MATEIRDDVTGGDKDKPNKVQSRTELSAMILPLLSHDGSDKNREKDEGITGIFPTDLKVVIKTWERIPQAMREGIMVMLRPYLVHGE